MSQSLPESDRQEECLKAVQKYCQEEISSIANTLDQSPEALYKAVLGLGQHHWLALRLPCEWGGMGLSAIAFWRFQILLARYSGALCFLQAQHQGAATLLLKSSNQFLKESYLPHLSSGNKLLGVGFSQLRRLGEPVMKAIPMPGGYQLNGVVPWVTGAGIFQDFIVGASLPNGEAVYGLVPLQEGQQIGGGWLKLSKPLDLAAMNSTRTAIASFENWFLEEDLVISRQPPGAIHGQDRHNVLNHGFFALGCGWAALDILEAAAKKKTFPFLFKAFHHWKSQLTCLEEKMLNSLDSSILYEEQLRWRSQAITLAGKCAHTAVAVSSGEANLLAHPAQRVYREALMFTVSGQTTDVMEATLKELCNQG